MSILLLEQNNDFFISSTLKKLNIKNNIATSIQEIKNVINRDLIDHYNLIVLTSSDANEYYRHLIELRLKNIKSPILCVNEIKNYEAIDFLTLCSEIRNYKQRSNTDLIVLDKLVINLNDRIVTLDDEKIDFTDKELEILDTLIRNKNTPISFKVIAKNSHAKTVIKIINNIKAKLSYMSDIINIITKWSSCIIKI